MMPPVEKNDLFFFIRRALLSPSLDKTTSRGDVLMDSSERAIKEGVWLPSRLGADMSPFIS